MIDFHYPHIPFCDFQNSASEKIWSCLTFVCMYIYYVLPAFAFALTSKIGGIKIGSFINLIPVLPHVSFFY